ncbi:MAG TPA: hypothetical protein VGY56_22150 [Verrucomicrobiae bacterium]|nr:hypothetical protein [Verrucomicrobiae bacterium]
MTVLFQTGKIPDLTAGERTGKTEAWRKSAAQYQQPSRRRGAWHSLCWFLVAMDDDAAERICGAVIHDSTFRLYI